MTLYTLCLNDMRSSQIENLIQVTPLTEDRQSLVDQYNAELVEPYKDGQWAKNFRAGGPLEWFNPARVDIDNDYFGGIYTATPTYRLGN